jgi:23S rRNA (cytidine1920-2'-O)/16S rRNA (cytidine1409-2'-O)-methyltransferase
MNRLDKELFSRGLVSSRSQAENYIKLGVVTVNGKTAKKPGFAVSKSDDIMLAGDQYVSRAALKLASIAKHFALDFRDKTVLDIGSSTGGFTDYALQHGSTKVFAIDIGTDQLHPSLLGDERIVLHEKTDIRDFVTKDPIDIMVADVSFMSLTKILPHLTKMATKDTWLIMMCKPQFEAGAKGNTNKGIIKNSAMRRQILKDFEYWLQTNGFLIKDKADSQVAGTKGNVERFYKLRVL